MKAALLIMTLATLSLPSLAFDADLDLDGNGRLELKDAIVLRDVLADRILCPEGKRCDITSDGRTNSDDYTQFVNLVKDSAGQTKPEEPAETIPEGDMLTVGFDQKFVLRLYDTAKLADGSLNMKYMRIKEPKCAGNATCPRQAILRIGEENVTLTEGYAKTVAGSKVFLQNVNNRNNSVWTISQACDGCRVDGECLPEGRHDDHEIVCRERIPTRLQKEGESCISDDECLKRSCIDAVCASKLPTNDVTTTPVATPTQDTNITISTPQKSLWARILDWLRTLF
ncbi:hypothetical protein HY641_01760 [Candidatus Woesearchaeota archaeon]|nr:hypothetical protein [Candidatus Woesearchaeota archaeon]